MYEDSTIEQTFYFFAVTGLNITQKLLLAFMEEADIQTILAEHCVRLRRLIQHTSEPDMKHLDEIGSI
jgi:hypothetical protein